MGWKSLFSVGRTQTGRKDKPVNSARRRICQKYSKAPAGQYDPAQIRWIMLDQVYKVPPQWMKAYATYTDDLARADLQSCASAGTLKHSNKIVRYNKLGIGSMNQAANFALKKYHGFSNKNVANYKQEGGAYSSMAALKDIRRGRRDKYRPETKGSRYSISRFGTVLDKKKPEYMYKMGQHAGPSRSYQYDWRQRHAGKPAATLRPTYTPSFMGQLNNMQAQRRAQQGNNSRRPAAAAAAAAAPNRLQYLPRPNAAAVRAQQNRPVVLNGMVLNRRGRSITAAENARRKAQSARNRAAFKAAGGATKKKNRQMAGAPSSASSSGGYKA